MEYKEGRLGYNRKNDRYGLLVTDLWEIDGFSCGNRLQVEINGEWVDTHMEMDWSTGKGIWYYVKRLLTIVSLPCRPILRLV